MKKIYPLLLILFLKSAFTAQIPSAAAWYPFCGDANDKSGNSRHAAASGCYLTTNRFGQPNNGYNFPGNGYMDIPNSTIMDLDTYCYSLWILISANPSTTQCIFSGGGNDIYDQNLLIFPSGGLFAVSHNAGGSPSASSVSSPNLTLNTWHHVVVLRNSTLMRMYVDNVLYTGTYHNGTYSVWGTTSPYNIFLGRRSNGLDYFIGKIDDVRLYAGNLSSAQVTSLYQESILPKIVASGDTVCPGEPAYINVSGAQTFTLPGTQPGVVSPSATTIYTVTGNSQGCVATATVQVVVDPCTGIGAASEKQDMKIYPNPFENNITVKTLSEIKRIEVSNLLGQTVLSVEAQDTNEAVLNLGVLEKGVYLIKITSTDNKEVSRKILRQ